MYTLDDLPPRLRHWHAPRVNRWEKLCVAGGTLTIEYLQASNITRAPLDAGGSRWFAPGMRWRIVDMPRDSHFTLEVHADAKGQAKSPEPLRSRVLQETGRTIITDRVAFQTFVRALPVASRHIVEGHFRMPDWDEIFDGSKHLFWHPLQRTAKQFSVLVARSKQPFDIATYLGRDHAVIEAALGQALDGDAESECWMRAALERHLHIEEHILFPAWLEVGGLAAHVNGLQNEHQYLRQHLQAFTDPEHRRKFLRLLDAHDEKEEQIIYPDIVARIGSDEGLLQRIIASPLPPA